MTYAEAYIDAADPAHKSVSETNDLALLRRATQATMREASAWRGGVWWFTEVEIALQAGIRLYDAPSRAWNPVTRDTSGEYIQLASYDVKTFRTNNELSLPFVSKEYVSYYDTNWTHTADEGSVYQWTWSGAKIAVYHTPSQDYIAENPYIWGTAYRELHTPKNNPSDTADDDNWDDEIDAVPRQYHQVIVDGITYHAFRLSRNGNYVNARAIFHDGLDQMREKSRPYLGQASGQMSPSPAFQRGNQVVVSPGYSDYGRR